jgi:membrane protein
VNIAVSLGFTTLLFAMIFKLMPTARIAWRDVWTGAFVTAILFEVGKMLISLYLGKSGVTESFAAAGSLVSNRRKGLQKKLHWARRTR